MDKLMTMQEVADRLNVTRKCVYNWVHDGKLEAYKVSSIYRVSQEQLEAFLNREEV